MLIRTVLAEDGALLREGLRATVQSRQGNPAPAGLSNREREVLGLITEGYSNAGITESLVVSEAAVNKHVGNIFTKLGLAPGEAATGGCSPRSPTCAGERLCNCAATRRISPRRTVATATVGMCLQRGG